MIGVGLCPLTRAAGDASHAGCPMPRADPYHVPSSRMRSRRGSDGTGVPGTRRREPAAPAGSTVRAGRPDARRADDAPAGNDAVRGDEAPHGARGRGTRHDAARRTGEAPLPEPRRDPPDPRPLDQQVRRPGRRRDDDHQAPSGRGFDGRTGSRLHRVHPRDTGADLARHHRRRRHRALLLRNASCLRLAGRFAGHLLAIRTASSPPTAKCSRSILRSDCS